MKSIVFDTKYYVNQVGSLHLTEPLEHHNMVRQHVIGKTIPEPKMKVVYSAKQSGETLKKPEITKLYIKNMVSIRCKLLVKKMLDDNEINYMIVELGEVLIAGSISDEKRQQLATGLLQYGLELMNDKKKILVEKIIQVIVEMIHYSDEPSTLKFSCYLSEKLNYAYTYLANLFSEVKGISIQHYIISHKIERVKELLVYDELNLTEIAWNLHYSSVAHLSCQFKKTTGLTPRDFKNMKQKRRVALENL